MKQPIAGIAGLKPRAPRAPKPEGDGRLSKQESRALDREYRVQRNETLRLKNHRETMLLAKARGELIVRELVERQAVYLLTVMRQRILALPGAYAGRLVGWPDLAAAGEVLREAALALLDDLQNFPERVVDPGWLEHIADEQEAGGAPAGAEERPAKARTPRRRAKSGGLQVKRSKTLRRDAFGGLLMRARYAGI